MSASNTLTHLIRQLENSAAGTTAAPPDLFRAASAVGFRSADPVLQTRFRTGEAAASALAAIGLVISEIWKLRDPASSGRDQKVGIDVRAAAAALLSFAHQKLDGPGAADVARQPNVTDFYPTRDGRWFLLHASFPPTTRKAMELLGCDADKDQVARAIAGFDAQTLEDEIAERGLCGARVRTAAEWRDSEQGKTLGELPVVEIRRIGDSPPEPFEPGERPLAGVRALDLTRVLAGPTCGRTLAEHGADVLRIGSTELPHIPYFVMDTSHGKRSAHLDLKTAAGVEQLRALARAADVFTQGYRGGALDRLGFGPEQLHELRPGIVYTSINCYGHVGPWRTRPGWEQLAQTVTGVASEHGGPDSPQLLPAAATDYTTGYLAALGTLIALVLRAREGGSWHVRASLSQTGMWLDSLPRSEARGAGVEPELLDHFMVQSDTPFGKLRHLGPVLELSATPPRWTRPTVPLGTHPAAW